MLVRKLSLSWGFIVAALASFALLSLSPAVAAAQAVSATQCKIVRTAGDVWLYPQAGEEYHQAEAGETMVSGDMLRVGEDSKVLLVFPGGTLLLLKENSDFYLHKLDSSGGAKLEIYSGGFLANVKKMLSPGASFEVQVPNSLAVVRGTVFGANIAPSGEVEFRGYQGEVELTYRGRKLRLKPYQLYRLARERAALAKHHIAVKEALKQFEFKARPPLHRLERLKNLQKAAKARRRRRHR